MTTRDHYIEQAIQEAKERQESRERGIDPDRDNDRGLGIEWTEPRGPVLVVATHQRASGRGVGRDG
jgi:hypothetical protein